MGMPMQGPPPGPAGPPPDAGGPPPPPPPSGQMVVLDVSIPAEVAQQVVPILQQLVQKVGGSIKPDDDSAEDQANAAGDRQTKLGSRANRPANLKPPMPTAGPAPMGPPMR